MSKKPSIDWSVVAADYNFLAVDKDGQACLYEFEPTTDDKAKCDCEKADCWVSEPDEDCFDAMRYTSYDRGDCDWRDSLVERDYDVPFCISKAVVDWSVIPVHINFIAMNPCGRHHGFPTKPFVSGIFEQWNCDDNAAVIVIDDRFEGFIMSVCDFTDSLVERPA